jgi:hypothetical protein
VDGAEVDVVLLGGERRRVWLPSRSGEIAAALDRLDEWVKTLDGGWVQKRHILEARLVEPESPGTDEEMQALDGAAGRLADQS